MSSAALEPKAVKKAAPQVVPRRYSFSVGEFNAMIEAGLFRDDRLELLNGEIIEMTPVDTPHSSCVRLLTYLLSRATENAVDVQNPLILNERAEVYPDLAVLKEAPQAYKKRKPDSDDVLILIEISDSTLHLDRNEKLPRYAEAGIPEVWIVDIKNERILVHQRPLDGVYGNVNEYKHGSSLTVTVLDNISFDADDILP